MIYYNQYYHRDNHCVTGGVARGISLPQNVSLPKWGGAPHQNHSLEPTWGGERERGMHCT